MQGLREQPVRVRVDAADDTVAASGSNELAIAGTESGTIVYYNDGLFMGPGARCDERMHEKNPICGKDLVTVPDTGIISSVRSPSNSVSSSASTAHADSTAAVCSVGTGIGLGVDITSGPASTTTSSISSGDFRNPPLGDARPGSLKVVPCASWLRPPKPQGRCSITNSHPPKRTRIRVRGMAGTVSVGTNANTDSSMQGVVGTLPLLGVVGRRVEHLDGLSPSQSLSS